MKRSSLALALAVGLAGLVGPSAAQEPIAAPAAPPPAPVCVEAGVPCEPCCEDVKTWKKCKRYCVPEATTIKKTRTEYRVKEDEICKARCTLCGLLGGLSKGKKKCGERCEDDCCDKCGKVRCRRRLVKRFVTEECPGTKCVPPKDCCEEIPPGK